MPLCHSGPTKKNSNMQHFNFDITEARHRGYAITKIMHLGRVVWQAARSCFSGGWNNDLGWNNDEGWSNG